VIRYCKMITKQDDCILVMIGKIEVTSYIINLIIISTALLAKNDVDNHMMKLTYCSDR
ncbi:MAG: hypothetical protein ACI90V_000225, partial [Bacillariaceae sp.]|jgi:hypothetical protein